MTSQKLILVKWLSIQGCTVVLYLEIIEYFQDLILATIISMLIILKEIIYQMKL